jgi:hypothetical protein
MTHLTRKERILKMTHLRSHKSSFGVGRELDSNEQHVMSWARENPAEFRAMMNAMEQLMANGHLTPDFRLTERGYDATDDLRQVDQRGNYLMTTAPVYPW